MTKAAKKPKRKLAHKAPTDPGGRFLYQMGRYMKTRGWNVLMSGPIGVVRGVDNRHQLVIAFLGVEAQKAAQEGADYFDKPHLNTPIVDVPRASALSAPVPALPATAPRFFCPHCGESGHDVAASEVAQVVCAAASERLASEALLPAVLPAPAVPALCSTCGELLDAPNPMCVAIHIPQPAVPALREQVLMDTAKAVVQGFRAKVAAGEITELAAVNAAMGITDFIHALLGGSATTETR